MLAGRIQYANLTQRIWLFIFFYANEHEPKHIHVMKSNDYAKIELINLRVVKNTLKKKELSRFLKIVKQNVNNFERKWDEYFS